MILKVNKDICEIKQNEVWNVGDYNVHVVQVELSPEFDGLVNKVRYFVEDNSYDMLITDNVAQVPYEATLTEGTIKIGVYGYDANTNILVQSTSPVNKYISSGTYTGEADNTEPLTPTDKEQMENAIQKNTNDITDLKENKQDKLISGVNIKTINNESILSSGNLTLVEEESDPIFTNSPAYSITDNDITYWNNKANMSDIPDVSNFITKDVDDLTYYTKSTDMQTAINNAVGSERTARENADNSLQNQIDAITVSSDVVDVVSTYQDLVDYDTQHIKANDIIKVMQDSTHDNAISYYRWVIVNHVGSWEYVGSEGPYYTKSETDTLLNAKQNTITNTNKLQSDLVDDTNQTNLFVTSTEKTTWNNKLDQSDLADYVKNTDYATSSKGGVIKPGSLININPNGIPYGTVQTFSQYSVGADANFISKGTLENVITGKNLETANNKVTSVSSSSTDVQYPSAKCVYDNDVIIQDDVNTKYDYLFSLTNLFGKITGTGTSVTLNDTAECPMGMELGASVLEQKTNYFNNDIVQGSISNGVDVLVNDRIKTAGYIKVVPGQVLPISFTGADSYLVAYYDSSKNFYRNWVWQENGIECTVPANVYYIRLIFKKNDSSNITPSSISNVQIGNIPNPDYPQTIHTISGNNDIKINNKNLLNISSNSVTNRGVTVSINDNNLKISGTASQNYPVDKNVMPLPLNNIIPAGTYTFSVSGTYDGTATKAVNWELLDENDNLITDFSLGDAENKYYQNVTTSVPIAKIKFYRNMTQNITIDFNLYIQLEEGSTPTTFEKFKQQTYPINLGDIEFCKVGDYKDVLFKNTLNSEYYNSSLELNKWYLKNNIGKLVLDGNEDYDRYSSLDTANYNCFYLTRNDFFVDSTGTINTTISNYFLGQSFNDRSNNIANMWVNKFASQLYFKVPNTITTSSELKTWLNTHNTIVYYVLATPTYTLLNDTLQTQLNNLQYALAYDTQTNISQTNTDLPFIIDAETYVDLTDYVKNTDYASSSTGGVIKTANDFATAVNQDGKLYARVDTYSDYNSRPNTSFISKGTLENVLRGYGIIE